MANQLKAGVAIVDISPEQGILLTGYPHYERKNIGIHDPLYASCIFLDDGETKFAFVAMDMTKYSKKYVRNVRLRVSESTGIPKDHITISCSHTHSGPLAAGRYDMEGLEQGLGPDPDYLKQLEDKLVSLVETACRHPFDARIGIEKGYCGKEQGVGGNRRDKDGITDPDVWVLGIRDMEERWRGCLVEYALHPTFIHGESNVVTADYPCYIRQYLAETKPGITVLFAQGTSGNQSSRYFRTGQNYREAKRVGETIAMEADRVLDSMRMSSEVKLEVKSMEVNLEIAEFPTMEEAEKQAAAAKKRLMDLRAANASYTEIRNAEVGLLGAENSLGHILAKARHGRLAPLEDELPAEIQVIAIGDARIVCLQGEIFVEYGIKIKSDSPYLKTCVIELSNGVLPGYVCTAQAYEEGGYEAGSSFMTAGAGETLTAKAHVLLEAT